MRSYGIEGFQKYIRHVGFIPFLNRQSTWLSDHCKILVTSAIQSISLNQIFIKGIKESKHLVLVTPPNLALSVFRMVPRLNNKPSRRRLFTLSELNELNMQLNERISARKDIALTQTELNGVFCIRMAIGAHRTQEEHIHKALALLNREAEETLKAWLYQQHKGTTKIPN